MSSHSTVNSLRRPGPVFLPQLTLLALLSILSIGTQAILLAESSISPIKNSAPSETLLELPSPTHLKYLRSSAATKILQSEEETAILTAIKITNGSKTKHFWMQLELGETLSEKGVQSIGTLYTSTGRKFIFESERSKLRTNMIGPIRTRKVSKSKSKVLEIGVNRDYLGLGLHRLHEFFDAVKRYRNQFPDGEQLSYTIRSTPFENSTLLFPPEVVEISQLTEASERAFVASLPALTEFFKIIYETDGLKDLLLELIPKKIFLSLINPFSKKGIQFNYGEPQPTTMDASEFELGIDEVGVIPLVLTFGTKPLLNLRLYTTEPTYEWQTCAGIAAVEVTSVEQPDKQCFIRAFPQKMIERRVSEIQSTDSVADEVLRDH